MFRPNGQPSTAGFKFMLIAAHCGFDGTVHQPASTDATYAVWSQPLPSGNTNVIGVERAYLANTDVLMIALAPGTVIDEKVMNTFISGSKPCTLGMAVSVRSKGVTYPAVITGDDATFTFKFKNDAFVETPKTLSGLCVARSTGTPYVGAGASGAPVYTGGDSKAVGMVVGGCGTLSDCAPLNIPGAKDDTFLFTPMSSIIGIAGSQLGGTLDYINGNDTYTDWRPRIPGNVGGVDNLSRVVVIADGEAPTIKAKIIDVTNYNYAGWPFLNGISSWSAAAANIASLSPAPPYSVSITPLKAAYGKLYANWTTPTGTVAKDTVDLSITCNKPAGTCDGIPDDEPPPGPIEP